jgi:hypothetical protein
MAVWVATGCSTVTEKYLAMVSSILLLHITHVYAELCTKALCYIVNTYIC